MTTLKNRLFLVSLLLVIALSGCNLPFNAGNETTQSINISHPTNGSTHPAGEWIIVRTEIAGSSGITSVQLMINGQVFREDKLATALQQGSIQQPWQPTQEGQYTLQSRAIGVDGSSFESSPVSIQVGPGAEQPVLTEAPTLLPENTPTPEETPSPAPPVATANQDSNCRFGPGPVYNVTGYLLTGKSAPIVGRNAESTWWVIVTDNGARCWVWDNLVTVSGDTSGVPVVDAPPTPVPTSPPLPAPSPTGPSGTLSCRSSVNLTWQAVSHPNGISAYNWEVSGPGVNESGQTAGTSVEFFVACGGNTYQWRVRAVDTLGNNGPFSAPTSFTIE